MDVTTALGELVMACVCVCRNVRISCCFCIRFDCTAVAWFFRFDCIAVAWFFRFDCTAVACCLSEFAFCRACCLSAFAWFVMLAFACVFGGGVCVEQYVRRWWCILLSVGVEERCAAALTSFVRHAANPKAPPA